MLHFDFKQRKKTDNFKKPISEIWKEKCNAMTLFHRETCVSHLSKAAADEALQFWPDPVLNYPGNSSRFAIAAPVH